MTIPPTDKKRNRPPPPPPPTSSAKRSKDSVSAPTEEEVDRFFAILTKMQVAVKYFESTAAGDGGWRKALEIDAVDLHAGRDEDKAATGASALLDLNAAPVGDDSV